jgi:MFS family permease
MDASSELVHALLPLYLAGAFGASMAIIGVIEGFAEGTAQVLKVFSGALSDRLGRRKGLALLGYGLGAITRPVFPLAEALSVVTAARLLDRVGKGIRGAPRDALIADVTPAHQRGAAYGLRETLDSVGAFLGPAFAIGLMLIFADDIRTALWFALIPAALSVSVLAIFVRETPLAAATVSPPRWAGMARLPGTFWRVVALGVLCTLARFSEAFLVLRAADSGLSLGLAPLALLALASGRMLVSYPAGKASDHLPATLLWSLGFTVLGLADGLLAYGTTPAVVLLGAALWGIHLGLTEGLLSRQVANAVPPERVGTAFGLFHLVTGLVLLPASALAGVLWQAFGPRASFQAGAVFACLSILLGLWVHRAHRNPHNEASG